MKKCCDSFKEHATNLTNFEKKKILLLQKELKVHQNAGACYICGKRFSKTKKKSLPKIKIFENLEPLPFYR